jgi:hypothetical protein
VITIIVDTLHTRKRFRGYIPYVSRILACNQNLASINRKARMCYVVRPDDVDEITRLWIIYVHSAVFRYHQQQASWGCESRHRFGVLSKYL